MLNKIFWIFVVATSCVLGGPLNSERIIGGENAVEGQFPYAVSIRAFPGMGLVCGATIIKEHWCLTATHCIWTAVPASTRIVGGSVFLNGGPNTVIHAVDRIVLHPEYDPNQFGNDVGLIRVTNAFVWTRYVQPIKLGSAFINAGLLGKAVGWGLTASDGTGGVPNHLQWITTTTWAHNDCVNRMGGWIRPHHMCTFSRHGQGICFGDSGGPLVIGDTIVGIAAFVVPCAVGAPDGWERTSFFYNWINMNSAD